MESRLGFFSNDLYVHWDMFISVYLYVAWRDMFISVFPTEMRRNKTELGLLLFMV